MNETKIKAYGYLKTDSPFSEIFPNLTVPLKSSIPIIPREYGAPHCYVVDGTKLSEEQITQLAKQLYQIWQPECESLNQAIAYIETGLPLKVDWFTAVGTDYRMLG